MSWQRIRPAERITRPSRQPACACLCEAAAHRGHLRTSITREAAYEGWENALEARRPSREELALADGLQRDLSPDAARLADALRLTAAGDRIAFEEVYRLTSTRLFGACLTILHDRADAEEALQDAYLSVWRSAGGYDSARGRPMTWLLTLTRNRAVDRLRAQAAQAQHEAPGADAVATAQAANSEAIAGDQSSDLARCLDALAVDDRGFIRTAFFEGLTYAELAARSALPLGTLKSRIRRALLKLRECLA